jgi:hypothetical protein
MTKFEKVFSKFQALIFVLLLALIGAISYLDRSFLDHQNLLTNPGMESDSASWVTSAGTYSTDTVNVHGGQQSAKITSASQTSCYYQDVTPNVQLLGSNMEYGAWVKTSLTNVQVCARQAGATVGTCALAPSTNNWSYVPVYDPGPASGSVGVSVCETSSSTGSYNVDDAYVGSIKTPVQIQQGGYLVGTSTWVQGTNVWSIASPSSSFQAFPANSSISAPTLTGVFTNPATRLPEVIIPNAQPGAYFVVANGLFYGTGSGSSNTYFTFSDGTTTGSDNGTYQRITQQSGGPSVVVSTFTYSTAQTNLTFQLEARENTATTLNIGEGATSTDSMSISVYYYPTTTQLTPNNAANFVVGSSSGTNSTGSSSFSTCASVTIIGHGYPIQLMLQPDGSSNTAQLGNAGTNAQANWRIQRDGTTISLTTDQHNNVTNGPSFSFPPGWINFLDSGATAASHTYTLQYNQAGGGTTSCNYVSLTANELVNPNSPAGFIGSMTSSSSTAAFHIESASFASSSAGTSACSSGTCVYVTGTGTGTSWMGATPATNTGTGAYTITFATGEFSSPPACWCATTGASSTDRFCAIGSQPTTSGTTLTTLSASSGGTRENDTFSIFCQGAH